MVKACPPTILDEDQTYRLLQMLALALNRPDIEAGGVLELSEWGGKGTFHTREALRSDRVSLDPLTVEGLWFVAAAVRAMANGQTRFGFDDDGLQRAAQGLSAQIDKVLDLYDS